MIDKSDILHNVKTGSDTELYLSRINVDKTSANFGKIKSEEGLEKFPYLTRTTGNSLKPTTEYIQSNELRKGGAESAPRPGNTSVDGSIDVELSPVTFDDNIACTFKNEWKRWTSDTDSDINFDHQHCAAGFFLTRANELDETVYNNDENLKPRRLINDGTLGTDDGILKVPAGCVVHEMTFGKKSIEYNVVKKYGGVENEDMYHVFKRLTIGTLDLNAQIGQIVTGSFTFLGDSSSDIMTEAETRGYFGGEDTDQFEDGTTTGNSFIDNLPDQATDTDQFTTREGDLWINGKNITFAQTLTFNIDKNMDKLYALFVKNAISKVSRKTAITCNLDTYLVPESKELYNFANNNMTFEILFAFEDKETDPEFTYLFQIFSAKAEDKDLSASGEDNYTMSIPLRSFGERLCRVFRVALPKARDAEFIPASTWTDAGTIKVQPNVAVTLADINGKITVKDTLKAADGTEVATQYPTTIACTDEGYINITEGTFSSVTNAGYREVEITLNGDTLVRTFGLTENVGPNPVTSVGVTVKKTKAIFTWTDSSSSDFDHVIVDIQDNTGRSIVSDNVAKGVQTYTVSGLTAGTDYIADFIAVDENGNKSTVVTQKIETTGVTSLSVTGGSETISATWTAPSGFTGVHVTLTKVSDGSVVDTENVLANATQAYSKDSLSASTEYKVSVVPYSTLTSGELLGITSEDTATTT